MPWLLGTVSPLFPLMEELSYASLLARLAFKFNKHVNVSVNVNVGVSVSASASVSVSVGVSDGACALCCTRLSTSGLLSRQCRYFFREVDVKSCGIGGFGW
jgi:hypothetical protein